MKQIVWILILALVLGLCGCGDSGTPVQEPAAANAAEPESEAPAAEEDAGDEAPDDAVYYYEEQTVPLKKQVTTSYSSPYPHLPYYYKDPLTVLTLNEVTEYDYDADGNQTGKTVYISPDEASILQGRTSVNGFDYWMFDPDGNE